MPQWEERITQDTIPAIANEHALRYRFAAGMIAEAPVWADLGCGEGVAAGRALTAGFDGKLILVDLDPKAVRTAEELLGGKADDVVAMQADLTSAEDLSRLRKALAGSSGGCITCFEVFEHLTTFVPLLELLTELSETSGYSVCLSVPNDAFWSMDNPHHQTTWSGEALEELRTLLPSDHAIAHQVPLVGSAVQPETGGESQHEPVVSVDATLVPSHYLVVFGSLVARVQPSAAVVAVDLDRQRSWERQREADLSYYRDVVEGLEPASSADGA